MNRGDIVQPLHFTHLHSRYVVLSASEQVIAFESLDRHAGGRIMRPLMEVAYDVTPDEFIQARAVLAALPPEAYQDSHAIGCLSSTIDPEWSGSVFSDQAWKCDECGAIIPAEDPRHPQHQ